MELKLYYHPKSTFSQRVRIYLAEKKISLPMQLVAMEKLEHKKRDYLGKNPYGKLPCLEVDGHFLYESMTIIYFLEDIYKENPIIHSDPLLKAKSDMAIRVCDTQMTGPATPFIFQRRYLPQEKWDNTNLEKIRKNIFRHLENLSSQLGENDYLIENKFSLVEIAYAPFFQFLPYLDIQMPENLKIWGEKIMQRASYLSTLG